MRELWRRISAEPQAFIWLLLTSGLLHACGFATAIYTILVFNNYLPYGVSGTLVALTLFAGLALCGEFYLREIRHRLVSRALVGPTRPVVDIFLRRLANARFDALENASLMLRRSWLEAFTRLTSPNLRGLTETLLDLPFAALFLLALFFLHPVLGLISTTAIGAIWLLSRWSSRDLPSAQVPVQEAQHKFLAIAEEALVMPEVVRAQRAHRQLPERLSERLVGLHQRADYLEARLQRSGNFNHLVVAAQAVLVTAIGSVLVFEGSLSLGGLIGASILAARALGPLSKFLLANDQFFKVDSAVLVFQRLAALPEGHRRSATLQSNEPEISVEGLAFHYPGRTISVFEPLSFQLRCPEIVVITGPNGSGKTTLIQMLAGIRQPTSGRILIQGVELQQLAESWWEDRSSYVPQDDRLLEGSVIDSLQAVLPFAEDERINLVLERLALKSWFDRHPEGLSQTIKSTGTELPPGIRRKIAIARALLADSSVIFLDEPTQALDMQGRIGLLSALNERFNSGGTLVLCSDDPEIVRGATLLIDLSGRTRPSIARRTFSPSIGNKG